MTGFSAYLPGLVLLGLIVQSTRVSTTALCADRPRAQTLLFVDDYEILYRAGTKRVLHRPVRHDANPLLIG